MPEQQSFYDCPNRYTGACYEKFRNFSLQRELQKDQLESLGQVAFDAVMSTYDDMLERRSNWANTEAVKSLKPVFESVADMRARAVNPKTSLVCTGYTLFRKACTLRQERA
jgi:hypothetical protein